MAPHHLLSICPADHTAVLTWSCSGIGPASLSLHRCSPCLLLAPAEGPCSLGLMTALYLAVPTTQPLLQAFDELLLLKRGGETIFNGQLGKDSSELIEYFQVRCVATSSGCTTSAPAADTLLIGAISLLHQASDKEGTCTAVSQCSNSVGWWTQTVNSFVFAACGLVVAVHWSGCSGHLSMPFLRSLRTALQRLECWPRPAEERC